MVYLLSELMVDELNAPNAIGSTGIRGKMGQVADGCAGEECLHAWRALARVRAAEKPCCSCAACHAVEEAPMIRVNRWLENIRHKGSSASDQCASEHSPSVKWATWILFDLRYFIRCADRRTGERAQNKVSLCAHVYRW